METCLKDMLDVDDIFNSLDEIGFTLTIKHDEIDPKYGIILLHPKYPKNAIPRIGFAIDTKTKVVKRIADRVNHYYALPNDILEKLVKITINILALDDFN